MHANFNRLMIIRFYAIPRKTIEKVKCIVAKYHHQNNGEEMMGVG